MIVVPVQEIEQFEREYVSLFALAKLFLVVKQPK
jgi:hypothetical protein